MCKLLSTKQVAEMLSISQAQLNKMRLEKYNKDDEGNLKASYIPFVKIGNAVRYKESDILEFISRNTSDLTQGAQNA